MKKINRKLFIDYMFGEKYLVTNKITKGSLGSFLITCYKKNTREYIKRHIEDFIDGYLIWDKTTTHNPNYCSCGKKLVDIPLLTSYTKICPICNK